MKWHTGQSLGGEAYTALVSDDAARELGRYWHRAAGFVPDGPRNNARPRRHEAQARYEIIRRGLVSAEADRLELNDLLAEIDLQHVPHGTGEQRLVAGEGSEG